MNWPSHIKAGRIDTPIFVTDYFPTILDLAGETNNYFGTIDGRSILPLVFDQKLPERPLFWHIASAAKQPALSAMRDGDWKVIQYLVSGDVELYNIALDPKETTNLFKTESKKSDQMIDKLSMWRKHNNVPLPPTSKLPY